MWRRLIPDTFIFTLLATVALASLMPAQGAFAGIVDALATAAIVMLFFFHGAKLPREAIIEALGHWRLHAVILGSTFLMFPLLILAIRWLAPGLLPTQLWTGMLFMAALPGTVQSAIAFTSLARGNVAAAIAASSASQLLGIFLTPPLVGLLADAHGGDVDTAGIGRILLILFVPFVAGHLARPWIGEWVKRHRQLIGLSDRSAILLAVYSAFSAAVIEGIWRQLPLPVLGTLVILCLVVLAIALLFTRGAARLLGFSRADEIAIMFCGTKKSIVQGVPMARVLFAPADVGLILMPILLFHQFQLMACAWIARHYAAQTDDADG
ncbi:solute carrier family 10 (sodium/bile acid cotransporter), member 7 [Sphingomonas laterariae]|uniref:Solute carrier family 10 (Sodium/bile acid cotransporter), member 7 n=1 Tax=Edaphosphingomonas laterariae TaxID=861865 RepID=A0A239D438_9SPHN|nr:bile acid:sodium symporter family protein [Sphingomonas laterariae]SNS26631.1 solute carrier family 10 (sodium/bile acid cotransporter), member 7 [Sphingomonas laterariae]